VRQVTGNLFLVDDNLLCILVLIAFTVLLFFCSSACLILGQGTCLMDHLYSVALLLQTMQVCADVVDALRN